jgi:hypothetical protein
VGGLNPKIQQSQNHGFGVSFGFAYLFSDFDFVLVFCVLVFFIDSFVGIVFVIRKRAQTQT